MILFDLPFYDRTSIKYFKAYWQCTKVEPRTLLFYQRLYYTNTLVKILVYFWKITVNIVPRMVLKRQINNTIAHNLNESINDL